MGRFRNPILPGCHPDPSICRVGDTYVIVTSTFEYLPALPLHVSRNLVDWELVGHAIHRPEQLDLAGLPGSRGLYAPTIRHHDGTFYVVCTVVGREDGALWAGRTGHFVVTATDVAGPWSDPIWIDGVGGFDPSLTFDDGRVWLVSTEPAANPSWPAQANVWLVELDPRSLQPIGEAGVIWTGALIGAIWAEGPHLLRRPGGGWMLLAAEGGTSWEHAVCVAYADDIAGPYVGDPGNPRLTHRDLGAGASIASVGHADLVEDQDGAWWATVLATRPVDGQEGLLGRQTFLTAVAWEDRRPVFAPGSGRVESVVEVADVEDQGPWPTSYPDDFDGPALDLEWNGVGRHPRSFADLAARPGHVRIAGGADPTTLGPQSFLGRRLPADAVKITAVLDLPEGDTSIRGGILLRTSERAHLEVSIDCDGSARCQLVADGVLTVLATRPLPEDRGAMELELEIRGLLAWVRVAGQELAQINLIDLVPSPHSGFVGVWTGPFAAGPDSEHIDVDSFHLEVLGA